MASEGNGVGPKFIPPVDRRSEGLTIEGFKPDQEVFLTRPEYDLLLRVAAEISRRTSRTFVVIEPEYQKDTNGEDLQERRDEEGNILQEGRVRIIKSGLYDEVFEPLRQMREQMLREESSPEEIEDTIKMTLGRDIEELNEATTELPR